MKSLPRKVVIAGAISFIGLILSCAYYVYQSAQVQKETSKILEFKLFQQ